MGRIDGRRSTADQGDSAGPKAKEHAKRKAGPPAMAVLAPTALREPSIEGNIGFSTTDKRTVIRGGRWGRGTIPGRPPMGLVVIKSSLELQEPDSPIGSMGLSLPRAHTWVRCELARRGPRRPSPRGDANSKA